MQTNRLLTEPVSKIFFRYLMPAIMANMVTSIYILADTIIIGKGIGAEAMAALNIILPLFNIFFGTGLLFGFGGYTVGTDNFSDTNFYDIGLNKEESIQGLTTMLQLIDKNLFYSDEFNVYQAFINQTSDLMIGPASLISSLESVYPNLGYQAIPNFVEETLPYTYMKIDTYQVTQLSENKQLAIEYLKFLLTPEVAKARYEMNKSIAPVDYENVISKDDYYTVVKKQLHRSVPLPNRVEFSYIYSPFQQAAQELLKNPNQIKSIMDDAVEKINKELELMIQ